MKKLYGRLTGLLLILTMYANAQKSKKNNAGNPFSMGTLSFTNRHNVNYTNYKSQADGDPKNFDLHIDPSYFILNGLAIGIDARVGSNSSKNTKSSYNSWQADLTVTYGRKITNKLNIYAKVFAGPGHSRSEFDISTFGNNPQILKAKYFDVKGLIGLPVALPGNDGTYLTPYISYDYYKTDAGVNNFKDKTVAFGFKLESYMSKGSGIDDKNRPSENAYLKHSDFLDFTTLGGVSLNNRQQYQSGGTTQFGKQKNTNLNFAFSYNYYLFNNLAVGLNFNVSSNKSGYVGSAASKTTKLLVQPVVTAHVPVEGALHNLFVQVAYGFGTYKEPKKKLTDFTVKTGYNLFLTPAIALTPRIGYEIYKGKVPSGVSGIPFEDKGLVAELGVKTWLNLWK